MTARRYATSFVDAFEAATGYPPVLEDLADYVEHVPLTPSQRRKLAQLLRSWQKPLPWRPLFPDTLDPATASDAQRAQLAQHEAAGNVLQRQDEYRTQHDDCRRVPGKVTDIMLAEAMAEAANKFNVALSLLTESAVRTLVKNKRCKAH
jgi:hypothetical protein